MCSFRCACTATSRRGMKWSMAPAARRPPLAAPMGTVTCMLMPFQRPARWYCASSPFSLPPPSSSSALPRLLPSTFFASETLYCHAGCAQLLQRPRLMQLLNHAACRSTAVAGAGPRWHLRQAFWAPRATRRRTRTSPPSSAHATLFENPKLASSSIGALHGSGTAQAAAIASGSCCRCCYCHRLPLPLPPSLLLLPLPPSLLLLLRRKRQW